MSMDVVSVKYPDCRPTNVVIEYDSKLDELKGTLGVKGKSQFELSDCDTYDKKFGKVIRIVHKDAAGNVRWGTDFTETGLDALRLALDVKFGDCCGVCDEFDDTDYESCVGESCQSECNYDPRSAKCGAD